MKGRKKVFHANDQKRKVAISEKKETLVKRVTGDTESHYVIRYNSKNTQQIYEKCSISLNY